MESDMEDRAKQAFQVYPANMFQNSTMKKNNKS